MISVSMAVTSDDPDRVLIVASVPIEEFRSSPDIQLTHAMTEADWQRLRQAVTKEADDAVS